MPTYATIKSSSADVMRRVKTVMILIDDYMATSRYFTDFVKIPASYFDLAKKRSDIAAKMFASAQQQYVNKLYSEADGRCKQAIMHMIEALMEIAKGATEAHSKGNYPIASNVRVFEAQLLLQLVLFKLNSAKAVCDYYSEVNKFPPPVEEFNQLIKKVAIRGIEAYEEAYQLLQINESADAVDKLIPIIKELTNLLYNMMKITQRSLSLEQFRRVTD